MRFRCGRGYQQTVLSIIRANFSNTRCNANWSGNVHHQYLKVLNASTCSFLLLAHFSFEHSLKWTDQNVVLTVTHVTMFCWELSKTNSLRWLHTLKASTAMLTLALLRIRAGLCRFVSFRWLSVLLFLELREWGFFFYLSCRFYPCVLLWGCSHRKCFCIPLHCFSSDVSHM